MEKNRVLGIYIETATKSFPIIYEVEKIKEGKPAFLFMNYFLGYNLNTPIAHGLFFPTKDRIEGMEKFFDSIKYKKTNIPDTSFLMALDSSSMGSTATTFRTIMYEYINGSYSVKEKKRTI